MQWNHRGRYLVMLAAVLVSLFTPFFSGRTVYAQDAPPVEPAPAAVSAGDAVGNGPPIRSTTFNTAGKITYPMQTRFNSTNAVTIEAWTYFLNSQGCQTVVDNSWNLSYWFGVCGTDTVEARPQFRRGNTGAVDAGQAIRYFTWNHLAVTYDGANVAFYINGRPAGGGTLAAAPLATADLHIGGSPASELLGGTLDEVRIWSVARTQQQIQDGIFKEIRSDPTLAATFGSGGLNEDIQSVMTPTVGAGIGGSQYGFLPKDLVVPRAATTPTFDGQVNVDVEYAGAEVMPIRLVRSDGDFFAPGAVPDMAPLEARFLRTETDLYIGINRVHLYCGSSCPLDPFAQENAKIAILLDTGYLRPELAQPQQNRLLIEVGTLDPATSLWQVGNGSGGFVNCAGAACVPRGELWDVRKHEFDGGEFNPDGRSVEIRISASLLGSFAEVDGIAVGQIETPLANLHELGPAGATMDSPATWATLAYGDASASLPQVKLRGAVVDFLKPGQPPLAGQKVSFGAIGINQFQTTTDAAGLFEFDVRMPFNKPMFLQVTDCQDCRFANASAGAVGIQPTVLGDGVSFGGCLQSVCNLADITLRVKLPPGPVTFSTPVVRPVARMLLNTTSNAATSATTAVIQGENLHEFTTFFVSPMPVLEANQLDPSKWILYPAPVVARSSDMKSVTVALPTLPKATNSVAPGSGLVQTLNNDWRWVAMDNWPRPAWQDKTKSAPFRLISPAYPEIMGLGFVNEATGSSFSEFTAVYGDNAYICIGAFGFCATHVPDPLYAAVYYPIYRLIISNTGGSCVGMSATSAQFANGTLKVADFDSSALFPAGITARGDDDYAHNSVLDLLTGPAKPQTLWAYVRTNHGRQVSSSVWRMSAEQLVDSAQDGFMTQQLQALRASPTGVVLSMKNPDAVFGGHAILPYAVNDANPSIPQVKVYDNNQPKSTSPFVDFNLNDDTFKFSGYAKSGGTLFIYPVSTWKDNATFPADIPGMVGNVIFGDSGASVAAGAPLAGGATPQNTTQALISTPQGQYGYLPDGSFVNTLPGVAPIPLFGKNGENLVFSPVLIPANGVPATITINSNQERYFFLSSANGTVLGLRGSDVTPGDRDTVTLDYEGTALSGYDLTPQRSTTELLPQIGMELGVQERLLFRFWQLDLEGGSTARFDVLPGRHGLTYANGSPQASEHFIIVDAVDGAAKQAGTRLFGPMKVAAGAGQRITVADWPASRLLKVETDADGDGVYEKTEFFDGRSCGSNDVDDNGVPDACQSGPNIYLPTIARP
jgi:hypothetical protein